MENMKINRYIDHTLLKPEVTRKDIYKLCREAKEHNFYSVCVNPYYVSYASDDCDGLGKNPKTCSVVGFPLGANVTKIKTKEAKRAVRDGAHEIDMVMNLAAFFNKDYEYVRDDIISVVEGVKEINEDIIVKVILECSLFSNKKDLLEEACRLTFQADADFVKTSTGYIGRGATINDVIAMKKFVGDNGVKVKASGGIKDFDAAIAMINAGANRIGTSSGVNIMLEANKRIKLLAQ